MFCRDVLLLNYIFAVCFFHFLKAESAVSCAIYSADFFSFLMQFFSFLFFSFLFSSFLVAV